MLFLSSKSKSLLSHSKNHGIDNHVIFSLSFKVLCGEILKIIQMCFTEIWLNFFVLGNYLESYQDLLFK